MPALVPEVADLIAQGKLPAYDADWIKNLKPENQLAAAEKMMRAADFYSTFWDKPKSKLRSGGGNTREDRLVDRTR